MNPGTITIVIKRFAHGQEVVCRTELCEQDLSLGSVSRGELIDWTLKKMERDIWSRIQDRCEGIVDTSEILWS